MSVCMSVCLFDISKTNCIYVLYVSISVSLSLSIPISHYLPIPVIPIYSHDYGYGESGLAAQIAYTQVDHHELWKFPSQYYTQTYPIYTSTRTLSNSNTNTNSNTNDTVIVGYVKTVYIDTTTLSPSENRCCNSEKYVYMSVYIVYMCI